MFLFAIDTGINLWLESCEEAPMRDEVDDNLIDFSDILNQVKIRNFSYKLPPSIRQVVDSKGQHSNLQEKSNDGHPKKKSKKNQEDNQSVKVENEGKIEKWIPSQETYMKFFRNSGDALKNRPKIDDTIMCHRFHSRGYCFDNCNNKKSHIPSSSLDPEMKKNYGKWVESTSK
jgi:hypothetical protein